MDSFRMTYEEDFCVRVKEARERSGRTQDQMADALGLGRSAYRHYEGSKRTSMMALRHIGDFCRICRIRMEWLITGKGAMSIDDVDWMYDAFLEASPGIQESIQILLSPSKDRENDPLTYGVTNRPDDTARGRL
jgi:transcriptional regulator with XRE-family HTH domain